MQTLPHQQQETQHHCATIRECKVIIKKKKKKDRIYCYQLVVVAFFIPNAIKRSAAHQLWQEQSPFIRFLCGSRRQTSAVRWQHAFPSTLETRRSCVELLPVVVRGSLGATSNSVRLHVSL